MARNRRAPVAKFKYGTFDCCRIPCLSPLPSLNTPPRTRYLWVNLHMYLYSHKTPPRTRYVWVNLSLYLYSSASLSVCVVYRGYLARGRRASTQPKKGVRCCRARCLPTAHAVNIPLGTPSAWILLSCPCQLCVHYCSSTSIILGERQKSVDT